MMMVMLNDQVHIVDGMTRQQLTKSFCQSMYLSTKILFNDVSHKTYSLIHPNGEVWVYSSNFKTGEVFSAMLPPHAGSSTTRDGIYSRRGETFQQRVARDAKIRIWRGDGFLNAGKRWWEYTSYLYTRSVEVWFNDDPDLDTENRWYRYNFDVFSKLIMVMLPWFVRSFCWTATFPIRYTLSEDYPAELMPKDHSPRGNYKNATQNQWKHFLGNQSEGVALGEETLRMDYYGEQHERACRLAFQLRGTEERYLTLGKDAYMMERLPRLRDSYIRTAFLAHFAFSGYLFQRFWRQQLCRPHDTLFKALHDPKTLRHAIVILGSQMFVKVLPFRALLQFAVLGQYYYEVDTRFGISQLAPIGASFLLLDIAIAGVVLHRAKIRSIPTAIVPFKPTSREFVKQSSTVGNASWTDLTDAGLHTSPSKRKELSKLKMIDDQQREHNLRIKRVAQAEIAAAEAKANLPKTETPTSLENDQKEEPKKSLGQGRKKADALKGASRA